KIVPGEGNQGTNQVFALDLRRDSIRVLPFPGQNLSVIPAFGFMRGVSENLIETRSLGLTAPETDQSRSVSAISVFEQARAQNIATVFLAAATISELDALTISSEAKARISAAVAAGRLVLVPRSSVTIGSAQRIAWYEF